MVGKSTPRSPLAPPTLEPCDCDPSEPCDHTDHRSEFLPVLNLPAHAEDGWLEVGIGEVRFRVERPCTRCTTVLVDQGAGVCDGVNWLTKVLAPYRLCAPQAPPAPDPKLP